VEPIIVTVRRAGVPIDAANIGQITHGDTEAVDGVSALVART
jgi:hypothetical protein